MLFFQKNTFKKRYIIAACCVLLITSLITANIFSQNKSTNKFRIKTVFIDPGHGGSDPGSLGAFSHEADVALNISLKFGSFIEKNYPDVKVVYARKTDMFVDLYERAHMANRCNADLFVCIHCNSAGHNKVPYGSETYTMGLHRTDDNFNVAKRENSVILLEKDYQNKYQGFDPNDPASYIMFTMLQNANLDQSVSFAEKVQDELSLIGRFNRGVKQAGFAVLVYTKMPSVLVETGFITNANEERFLNSDEGSNAIAQCIYNAFASYKAEMENTKPIINKLSNVDTIAIEKPIINSDLNFYKVLFYSSVEPLPIADEKLQSIKGFQIEKDNRNKYNYYSVKCKTEMEAENLLQQYKKLGFSSASIIEFKDGKKLIGTEK